MKQRCVSSPNVLRTLTQVFCIQTRTEKHHRVQFLSKATSYWKYGTYFIQGLTHTDTYRHLLGGLGLVKWGICADLCSLTHIQEAPPATTVGIPSCKSLVSVVIDQSSLFCRKCHRNAILVTYCRQYKFATSRTYFLDTRFPAVKLIAENQCAKNI